MAESIITISLAALIAGFVFSIPIAGPISILITSGALKGNLRYCHRANIGAAIADFIYVFIGVFGLTRLYSLYKPAIPYIFFVGALYLVVMGYRTARTKVDLEHLDDEIRLPESMKRESRGGLMTGFLVNFLNPSLFLGWLTTSFLVISFVASMGLKTGGLDTVIKNGVKEIKQIEGEAMHKKHVSSSIKMKSQAAEMELKEPSQDKALPKAKQLVVSLCYAFFLAAGSVIWFYFLAVIVARHRHRINGKIINGTMFGLGIVLCLFGLFFAYTGIFMLI